MKQTSGLFPSRLAPEMEALMLRVEQETGPQIDPTTGEVVHETSPWNTR